METHFSQTPDIAAFNQYIAIDAVEWSFYMFQHVFQLICSWCSKISENNYLNYRNEFIELFT
jgi:hypothetical protein